MGTYTDIHRASIKDPTKFWADAAEGIDWETRWDRVLDDSDLLSIAGSRSVASILATTHSTGMLSVAVAHKLRSSTTAR